MKMVLTVMATVGLLIAQPSFAQVVNPDNIEDWSGKTIMYFSPHPDDEISSSGTLAKLARNGNTIYVVLYTNGNKGSHDMEMSSERLAAIRRQEDFAANGIVGIPEENIFFLGYDDGMLEYVPEKELCEKACWFIRKYRPDAVFSFDPGDTWVQWQKTDHRMSAKVSLDGARAAAYHLYFPQHLINEGLQSFTVQDFFFYGSEEPNFQVDITDTAELKWQALCQHTSQYGSGNMKYIGPEMTPEDKENLRQRIMRRDSDGKIYERFRRVRESLSF